MALHVVDQPDENRYALEQDGEVIGVAEYTLADGIITFTHTEVDPERRERGMASQLVREALDDVRRSSERRLVASCPYVSHWLTEHPDYQELQDR